MEYPYKWASPEVYSLSADSGDVVGEQSPLLSYLDVITNHDKFNYVIVILICIIMTYRLNLHWSIWIGCAVGLLLVYYFNERSLQELNREGDRLWTILRSPLLNKTKYFITDPELIQWVDDVSEFKQFNVLEFNKMVASLDDLLKLHYNIKQGISNCGETLDLIRDIKTKSLNQYHSLIHSINHDDLRRKFNYYNQQLSLLLNRRMKDITRICKLFYDYQPINIDSKMSINDLDDPLPMDTQYNGNYNFFN